DIGAFEATSATHLVVTTSPPETVTAGAPFGLTVNAEDDAGTLDPNFNSSVTIALASNPGNDTLGGKLTVTASNGVATFSGVLLHNAGIGYTLQATGGGLTPATTTPINVTTPIHLPTPPPPPLRATAGPP